MRIWSVRGSSWRTSSAGAFALQDEGRASNATSQRIRQLERELARKEKALAEAAALLVLKKIAKAHLDEDDDAEEPSES